MTRLDGFEDSGASRTWVESLDAPRLALDVRGGEVGGLREFDEESVGASVRRGRTSESSEPPPGVSFIEPVEIMNIYCQSLSALSAAVAHSGR